MLEYRSYQKKDYEAYCKFSKRNFGWRNYQSKSDHLDWLQENPSSFFNIAVDRNEILGCIHGFEAPVLVQNNLINFYVIHDLMIDKDNRGIGVKLMKEGIFRDQAVILAGASGKISQTYKKIGSKKFDSQWHKKILVPKKIFNRKLLLKKIQNGNSKNFEFSFTNNKQPIDKRELLDKLDNFYPKTENHSFYDWRFFSKNSPINYFVSDKNNENVLLFNIGTKGIIPFLRIHSIALKDRSLLAKMIKSVENFAKNNGIPIVLFTLISKLSPPKELRFRPYKVIPDAYWFSKKKNEFKDCKIEGFITDMGFNGYL